MIEEPYGTGAGMRAKGKASSGQGFLRWRLAVQISKARLLLVASLWVVRVGPGKTLAHGGVFSRLTHAVLRATDTRRRLLRGGQVGS
jgi:hypothetical protein